MINSDATTEQDVDNPAVGLLYKGMRILSAVILILWTVCFGRCLADRCGLLQPETQAVCEHSCCQPESDENKPSPPTTTCEVCEFVKSGGSPPGQPLVLEAPQLIDFTLPEFHQLILRVVMTEVEAAEVAALDTGQTRIFRLCEWMSSTAAPVRGPNA